MVNITFITADNEKIIAQGNGGNLMELAVANNVAGIDGDCGGVCSCATCHVHVHEAHMSHVGEASEIEKDMLELDDNANERSRLCCQIDVTAQLDGLIVTVPA